MLNTPVLLITFNRPVHTRRVLEAILAAAPQDLYVFQDGPRDERDREKCEEVRNVVASLPAGSGVCLHSRYSDVNLGCGPGPMTALNWFFSENDRGIIIEDDAVPHADFFPYCEELLERYAEDESVCAIASMNVDTRKWGDGSYYFSRMNRNLCAWATWKRAWQRFDLWMKDVSRRDLQRALCGYGCGPLERAYWCDRLDDVHKDACGGNSWDMQFFMSVWMHGGKGIVPNVNLSSNIGTVGEATHSMRRGNLIDNIPTQPILPLVHPSSVEIQRDADREFHFRYFEPRKRDWGAVRTCYDLLNRQLKRLTGHEGPWLKKKR